MYRPAYLTKYYVFLCLYLLVYVSSVISQLPEKSLTQYTLSTWKREQGLPGNTVSAITQTKDRYLWMTTFSGICKFDGRTFTHYHTGNTPEIQNNTFGSLYQEENGTIWFSSRGGGVLRLQNGTFQNYDTKNGLAGNTVYWINKDNQGGLWFACAEGLSKWENGSFKTYRVSDGLPNNDITRVIEHPERGLWVGTRKGIYWFDGNNFTMAAFNSQLPAQDITALAYDTQGDLWIGTTGGLCRRKNKQLTVWTTAQGLPDNRISVIYQDHNQRLWIGTLGKGLALFKKEGVFETLSDAQGLSDNQIQTIHQDHEGNIWIGTYRGGLNRLRNDKFQIYGMPEGLTSDQVYAVAAGKNNDLWIGTVNGIAQYQNGKIRNWTKKDGLVDNYVRGLHVSDDGTVWIATYGGGISAYKDGKFKNYTTENGLSDNTARCIIAADSGALWIGTRNGLNYFKDGKFKVFNTGNGLSNNSIIPLAKDEKNRLWIGTDGGGLCCYENNQFKCYAPQKGGLASGVILGLYPEPGSDRIWIGTNAGLCLYENGTIHSFGSQDGLPDIGIFQIIESPKNTLWLTGSNGIFSIPKNELLARLRPNTPLVEPRNFDTRDGMRTTECSPGGFPGVITDKAGTLWFATLKGVAALQPDNLKINLLQPPVYITSFITDSIKQDLNTALSLSPGFSSYEFHFTALTFTESSRVKFRYKLEGFDKDWHQTSNETAVRYTNLPPGNYTFKVSACNSDGVWNEKGVSLQFNLQPWFYQTIWFYVLVCLIIGFSIYLWYQWRIAVYKTRQRQLEQLIQQRTADLQIVNTELNNKNDELYTTLENLKQTQTQLIQSEKMAALGQLIAGVAHEINTPIAAIQAAVGNLQKNLPNVLEKQPLVYQTLNPEQIRIFNQLLEQVLQEENTLTSREERQLRKQTETFLKENGFSVTENIATHLVKTGLAKKLDLIKSLLKTSEPLQLLEFLGNVGQLRINLSNIGLASEKTHKIVFALKSYSRKDAGGVAVLGNIINNIETVLTIYHNQIKQGIELITQFPEDLPLIWIYPDELNQVWTNIIHNAIQAMKGQGTLKIQVQLVSENTDVVNNYQWICVAITDNGPGIPEEILPRIFEPFFTTKPQGEGSGLGLDICRRIIEKHNGKIKVNTKPGETSFSVYLPVTDTMRENGNGSNTNDKAILTEKTATVIA